MCVRESMPARRRRQRSPIILVVASGVRTSPSALVRAGARTVEGAKWHWVGRRMRCPRCRRANARTCLSLRNARRGSQNRLPCSHGWCSSPRMRPRRNRIASVRPRPGPIHIRVPLRMDRSRHHNRHSRPRRQVRCPRLRRAAWRRRRTSRPRRRPRPRCSRSTPRSK
jgi:hypothetical protein